jgi:hypothetical protein
LGVRVCPSTLYNVAAARILKSKMGRQLQLLAANGHCARRVVDVFPFPVEERARYGFHLAYPLEKRVASRLAQGVTSRAGFLDIYAWLLAL